jgi:hypothetical protein
MKKRSRKVIPRAKLIYLIVSCIAFTVIVVASILKATAISTIASITFYFGIMLLWAWGIASNRVISLSTAIFSYITINLVVIDRFARIYRETGLLDSTGQIDTGKWETTYFSVLSWTGMSYGDLLPTSAARPWVVGETVIGYVSLAILVSLIVIVFERGRIKPAAKPKRRPKSWGRYCFGRLKRRL